ncbi:MAG: S46 family peptidase [Myxococcota bacterium]
MLLPSLIAAVLADEGMWLPEQLSARAERLKKDGLAMDVAALADPKGEVLGSVVSLGHCSAAFVSSDGLLVTNAHCVQPYLDYASDPQHNYVREGYLAAERKGELMGGPTARIWVTEGIEDVTAKVLGKVKKKAKDVERLDAIERASKELVAACEATPHRDCQVVPFYDGREYKLVTRLEIKDVRVAYAPPEPVYAFGGDEDNWMWPRQCGDFALLRAYVGADGQPADPAATNVPYKAPRHLRVAPSGASPGDFVMIAGYPGTTLRWRTADEAKYAVETRYPDGLSLVEALVQEAKGHLRKDAASASRLSQAVFYLLNVRKNYQGMLENFVASKIVDRKRGLERELDAWIAADPARQAKYAAAVKELRETLQKDLATARRDRLYNGLGYNGKLLGVAVTAYRLAAEREKPDVQREPGFQDRDVADVRDRFHQLDRTLHLASDRDLLEVIVRRTQELPADQRIPPIDTWLAQNGGDVDKALDVLYASPALASPEAREKLLGATRAELEASQDPWVKLGVALETWHRGIRASDRAIDATLLRLRPVYMDALLAFRPGEVYPDANGTLRVSFGRVAGYEPEDGVTYQPQTDLGGLVAKVGQEPFDAPDKVLAKVQAAPSTKWADPALGQVPVNFLSTLDNTGGSSGSPTLNARGELVGLVFDRNWDAVAADWIFDPATTRSIHVDVRYMFWMLAEVEGAKGLVQEMGVYP